MRLGWAVILWQIFLLIKRLENFTEMLIFSLIVLIVLGNLIYAYQCIFQTRKYIEKYGFGEGSAIMTRLVGTFAAGFAVTLAIALFTSIEGAWLLFVYGFVQACIGAGVCYQTIHSYWGSVDGVKTSAEAVSYTHLTLPTICSV